jgi:triosephosphate isomerase
MRKPLMAGNWKMNVNHFEAIALVQKIAFALTDEDYDAVDVVVLPPFTDLRSVQTLIDADGYRIDYGSQDVSAHTSGAYTGEVSASMLAKLGCDFVTVGHSERRQYHGETDELVAAKAAVALAHSMTPIICVGENLAIRQAGEHIERTVQQLAGSIAGLSPEQVGSIVVAYEPVWAIGTGEVATPGDAQEVCSALRGYLSEHVSPSVAQNCRILYGGSVKLTNIAGIMNQKDVDGALIGGASLDAEEFVGIVRYRLHPAPEDPA